MEILRDRGAVVVHCPGSHAFFGHERHPVAALREAGVPVALGTDGLVCHPDGVLSMPTLMVFRGGEPVKSMVGARPKRKLLQELEDVVPPIPR